VVAYCQKLPIVRAGAPPMSQSTPSLGSPAEVSGRRPPVRTLYFGSSPLSPWHEAHRRAKRGLPSAAVPLPGGRPWPLGGMGRSQALASWAVGARPTPYVGSWAWPAGMSTTAMRSRTLPAATTRGARRGEAPVGRLDVDIVDTPVGGHFPALDGVVVVDRVE